MTDKRFKLAAGGLLHDVGKLLYRYNDPRNHSTSGCDLIKQYITDKDILDCVQYHHGNMLKNSDVADNALCYITYIADNIAAFSDRRKSENGEGGFVRNISYQTVFNILNGNNEKNYINHLCLILTRSYILRITKPLIQMIFMEKQWI